MEGLFRKYVIRKANGKPIDPQAMYFVLRIDTDPVARKALWEYARETDDDELRDALCHALLGFEAERGQLDLSRPRTDKGVR